MDWHTWHNRYADRDSELAQRLAIVQQQIRVALDRMPAGQIKAISMCAGQGHDLIGALAGHQRRGDVEARLVELDARNVDAARRAAHDAKLAGVEVIAGDASLSDAYVGAVPAALVLICGVFGNISSSDAQALIAALPQLCAENATVIWTRHRRPEDITPAVRRWFEHEGFDELAFETESSGQYAVGTQRLGRPPVSLRSGQQLFEFKGFWAS